VIEWDENGLEIGEFSETFCNRFACDYGALMPSVECLYLALYWAFLLPGNTQGMKTGMPGEMCFSSQFLCIIQLNIKFSSKQKQLKL